MFIPAINLSIIKRYNNFKILLGKTSIFCYIQYIFYTHFYNILRRIVKNFKQYFKFNFVIYCLPLIKVFISEENAINNFV